jgi:hypothetical protein
MGGGCQPMVARITPRALKNAPAPVLASPAPPGRQSIFIRNSRYRPYLI